MKLSIIIPCHNVQNYISDCLQSLLPLLTDECEVIIIDDFSTDETVKMIRYCVMQYSMKNITLICNPANVGVSASRNFGIKHSTGEYIAFIDSDDMVTKKYISEILQVINAHLDYYLLSWKKIGGNGETYFSMSLPSWNRSVWSRIIKKSIIVHMFDESMTWAEDVKFLEENITRGMKFAYINEVIYLYRWGRSGSITSKILGRV